MSPWPAAWPPSACRYARELGAETVQVFVANPRGWATPPGNPTQDEEFRAACAAEWIPAYVHAPYLINFGSHTEATVERSVESLRHSLRRGREIGALGVVVHTGSATGGRARAVALAQVREHMLPLLDELTHDDDPFLLLESTAGQGSSLCSRTWDFGPVLRGAGRPSEAGRLPGHLPHLRGRATTWPAPSGMQQTLDLLVDTVGEGRLKLIHANDSKDVVGAHKDRHENIGSGHIGEEPVPGADAPPGDRGRAADHRDARRQGGARGGRGPAEETSRLIADSRNTPRGYVVPYGRQDIAT